MKWRFSLFTYPMMDMKVAEAELNRRAAAGRPSLFRPMYRCATVSTETIRAGTTGPITALYWSTWRGAVASAGDLSKHL